MKGSGREKKDEVEQLLEAAQDEMMLKLSVDAHMSRVSPDYLDPDLHSRFLALRSRPSVAPPARRPRSDRLEESEDNDDLLARFAALKDSLPTSSSIPPAGPTPSSFAHEDGEEDEVEKVIQWAMDAARLDPSSPSDDEHDGDHHQSHSHSSEDDGDGDDDDDRPRKDDSRRRSRG